MRHINGASIAQYAIIIALIALAVFPIYFIHGQNIVDHLKNFYNVVTDVQDNVDINTNPVKVSILNESVSAGGLGGTPENPVMDCAKKTCAIDYGSIILNGVPANFNEIVETSGTSGGTEEILALLEQVAVQKEQDPETTPQELTDLKNLISRGREIVEIEKVYDSFMSSFLPDVNGLVADRNSIDYYNIIKTSQTSYTNEVDKSEWPVNVSDYEKRTYEFPPGFVDQKNLIEKKYSMMQDLRSKTNFDFNINDEEVDVKGAMYLYMMLNPSSVIHVNDTGKVDLMVSKTAFNTNNDMEDYLNGKINIEAYKGDLSGLPPEVMGNGYFTTSPVSYFLKELNNVMANTTDSTVKDLTSTLSGEVLKISQRASESYLTVNNYIWSGKDTYSDPDKLKNPAAETTRLDLMIICVSNGGDFDSINNKCN
ncbi:MAG: hypothetical protein AB1782_00755 [Cyanobacteriota bacterium]